MSILNSLPTSGGIMALSARFGRLLSFSEDRKTPADIFKVSFLKESHMNVPGFLSIKGRNTVAIR